MKAAILHLSDLHLREKDNYIIPNIPKIYDSIKLDLKEVSQLFIVITGDIVDKGQILAYEEAKTFLTNLKSIITDGGFIGLIRFVIVPGNHDCNFDYDNQLRRNTIQSISYETLGEDTSVIDSCTSIQKDFWDFYEKFNKMPLNKLFYQTMEEESNGICFNCFNTAWMSRKVEEQNLS